MKLHCVQISEFHYSGWWLYCIFSVISALIRIPGTDNRHSSTKTAHFLVLLDYIPVPIFLSNRSVLSPFSADCFLLLSVFPASADAQTHTTPPQQRECNEVSLAELRPRCCWPLCGQPAAAVPAR